MAVTKASFQGHAEEQRQFQQVPGGRSPAEDLIESMVGADAMQSLSAKGLTGPFNPMADTPRRAGAAQAVPAGNDSSTGAAGPFPAGAAHAPITPTNSGQGSTVGKLGEPPNHAQVTGAGQGSRIIKTYGSGGISGVGGATR